MHHTGHAHAGLIPCLAENPTSLEVVASLVLGMEDVTILSSRTPKDIVQRVRAYHILWHFGSACTFVPLFRETLEIQSAWSAHCELTGTLSGDPFSNPSIFPARGCTCPLDPLLRSHAADGLCFVLCAPGYNHPWQSSLKSKNSAARRAP